MFLICEKLKKVLVKKKKDKGSCIQNKWELCIFETVKTNDIFKILIIILS